MADDAPSSPIEIWRRERPRYQRLAKAVEATLAAGLRERGIRCEVTSRAKSLDSFVKKMIRKRYGDMTRMGDKAGARVVCLCEEHRQIAITVAQQLLKTSNWDEKRKSREADRLGYLGVHCDAQLLQAPDDSQEDLLEVSCEVQFHTVAEHAWNAPFHDLIYKPPEGVSIPPEISRLGYRLLALTEIYDSELTRTRDAVQALPNYGHAALLRYLDEQFYRLTAREYDRDLSFEVIAALLPLYGDLTVDQIAAMVAKFYENHEDKLQALFMEYEAADPETRAFIMQPESVMVFERIVADRYVLEDAWVKRFDTSYLQTFFLAWGESMA